MQEMQIRGEKEGNQFAMNSDKAGYDKALEDAIQDYYKWKSKDPNSNDTKRAIGYYDGLIEGWARFLSGNP